MQKKPTKSSINKYLVSLNNHLKFFREAAEKLGIPEAQIKLHDLSKRSDDEIYAYTRKFVDNVRDRDEFGYAWLHHIHNNPHHWQHWILYSALTPKEAVTLAMPEMYIREMVADWMGANKSQVGSFDMTAGLKANLQNLHMHPTSIEGLIRILVDELGYDERLILQWL